MVLGGMATANFRRVPIASVEEGERGFCVLECEWFSEGCLRNPNLDHIFVLVTGITSFMRSYYQAALLARGLWMR